MSAYDIQPVEETYQEMRRRTAPATPVPETRGPLVYNVTREASTNGVDETCKDKPGGCVHEP